MSKFKGTPGPWIVDRSVIRGDADHLGRTVAVASTLNVAWPFGRRAIKEKPYNACLIAAAPDLLEALERLVTDVERGTHVEFGGTPWLKEKMAEIDYARAAIAKALGEDQP